MSGAPVWGKVAKDHLQAGICFPGDRRQYALGETVTFNVLIRNAGRETVEFNYPDLNDTEYSPAIFDQKNSGVDVYSIRTLLFPAITKIKLEPGEMILVAEPSIQLRSEALAQVKLGDITYAVIKPGKYKIHQLFGFKSDDCDINYQTGDLGFEVTP